VSEWAEPDIAQTTSGSAQIRSISVKDSFAEPLELRSVVGVERDAEILESLVTSGEEPLRLLGLAASGCHGGPIQAAPCVAVGVADSSSVALPEPHLSLADIAEMELDPAEVVLFHRNPGGVPSVAFRSRLSR
jgi:hypothetical protein